MFRNGFYSDKAVIALIPKNASTAISAYCAWTPTDYTAINRRNYIAVIRDPVDRWVSGATEYIWRCQRFEGIEPSSFDLNKIHLDKHTQPQVTFIDMLDPKRVILYPFGPDLLTRMQDDWNCFRKTAKLQVINTIDTDESKIKVREHVIANADFDKVREFYSRDFDVYQKSLG
jgi:hypothetical protein